MAETETRKNDDSVALFVMGMMRTEFYDQCYLFTDIQ